MKYRALGNTGLQVSEIGLGAEWMERLDQDTCTAIIRAAQDRGINILDCWMAEPGVRTRIGNALAGHREKWILQGHIGSTWQDGQYVKTRDAEKCRVAFQDLLDRMQTDYIDLGMIHYVDSVKEFEELLQSPYMDYVRQLKEKGIIRHVGMGSHNPAAAKAAVLSGEIEMLMFSVNPAFDLKPSNDVLNELFKEEYDQALRGMNPERAELYALCEERGIGITVMKGYAAGRLLDAAASPFKVALTPVQCLHYALTRPAVCSVLVGYTQPEQVEEAVRYETASEEEKAYAPVLAAAPMHAFSGRCMYCNHCKPCPMDIDIAMVNKLYDLAVMQPQVPASVKAHYLELEKTASDCIGCGGCEQRCPFGVPVISRMALAKELFQQ